MIEPLLVIDRLRKTFPPNVVALEDASFSVRKGEVHCLLGANGAGKSTLLKIIAGVFPQTEGSMLLDDAPFQPHSPAHAAHQGISMIYQELDLIPHLSVKQNLFLSRAPHRFGIIQQKKRNRLAQQALDRIGAHFSIHDQVQTLSLANQQLTAIARSLTLKAKVIIMDEPSAALNETELERVFEVIRSLVKDGVAIIYVSHRMNEIQKIADRITVLRGGQSMGTYPVAETSEEELVSAVVGENRSLTAQSPELKTVSAPRTPTVLSIKQLTCNKISQKIN